MGSRPSILTSSSTMSDSESVTNKENPGWEINAEEQKPIVATDGVKMESTEPTVDSKKKPTFEKFVHLKLRAKRIAEENQAVKEDLEVMFAKIARIQKRKSDLLVKVREVQAKTDIQATEPEDWEDYENISEQSDSSSSEEEELVLPIFNIRTAPKRRPPPPVKKGNMSKRMRKVVEIPKDEFGKPILPIQIGSFQLISIGKVELRDGYYNERYIWPVGYCIKRTYMSMKNKHENTEYTCTIEEDGDAPKFCIVADDDTDHPIEASTATGAWGNVVRQANRIRGRGHLSCSVSGPEYFGYAHPAIADLINEARSDRV
ncbi:hypothetical protein BGW37DRAFT_482272 [Umbelopsis sp. PMI_123]|nr:hypothetical protein BGW37DRAFT_482272 [Umbelopsis sp. PMI_123]